MPDIQFYAYIHRRPDGSAFYVGKGCKRRAWCFSGRSLHHKRIVAKHGRENITIEVLNADSEAHAYALEKALIRIMKAHEYSIANKTEGGDVGPTGFRHTEEAKRKIGEAGIGRKNRLGHKTPDSVKRKLSEKAKIQWERIRAGEILPPARSKTARSKTARSKTALSDAEKKQIKKEAGLNWRAKNKEHIRQYNKQYAENHK